MTYDPKKPEDEWFVRNERELIKNLKRERERKQKELAELLKQEEALKQKELHWMKCPKCGSDLKSEDVEEVTIERCPACDGIFLDRGEFEQILFHKQEQRHGFRRRVLDLFLPKK